MIKEGTLLKLVVEKQAIIYKVINVKSTAVQVLELCTIAGGRMVISYGKRLQSHIFQSDIGTRYNIVKCEELSKILEILHNMMVEVGY